MAEKSFFANILKFITKVGDNSETKNISVQQALSLQKDFIENLNRGKINACTPPYIEISKQLKSEKSEVFKASVYYLSQIAKNEAYYKAPIVSILKHYKEKNKRAAEDIQYLDFYLKQLEK